MSETFETGTGFVTMTCCGSRSATVAETIGHVCPRNRVWVVRAGTDGIGLDLFHVYAPTMDAARESAKDAATAAGFVFGDAFTVHALRDGEPIDWFATLGHNVVTDRPAIDFDDFEKATADDLDRAADVIAGIIFLAILGEVVEELIKNGGNIPATPES